MSIKSFVYAYIVNEEEYPDKTVIIEENSKGDWVYLILKGKARVKKKTPKRFVTVDTLKEGDIFGEMALLEIESVGPFEETRGRRTASIVADGPVKVGVLDKQRLLTEFESLSPQLKELIKSLVSRLENTTRKAALLAGE